MVKDSALIIVNIPNDQLTERHEQNTTNDTSPSFATTLKTYLAEKVTDEAIWMPSIDQKTLQVTFHVDLGAESDQILYDLNMLNINKNNGCQVCVVPAMMMIGSQDRVQSTNLNTSMENDSSNKNCTILSERKQSTNTTAKNRIYKHINVSNFKKSVRARLMVHQVVAGIRSTTALSFDFVILVSLASMLAAFGLLESSSVIIVASMLVSPLMNPIMGIVFGLSVREQPLWRRGIQNELIGLALCIVWGFVIGLCTTHAGTNWGSSTSFPTSEMKTRGDIKRLWVGVFIALPSGAGVALSVLGGNTGSLVGVAISASLLPPAVNCGLLWAYAALAPTIVGDVWGYVNNESSIQTNVNYFLFQNRLHSNAPIVNCSKHIANDYLPYYSCNMAREAAILGSCSLLLTMVNIVCIIIMALLVLRIKEVAPLNQANEAIETFFHHDVKVARNYNRTVRDNECISEMNFPTSKSITGHWKGLVSSTKDKHRQLMYKIRTNRTYNPTTLTDMNSLQMYAKEFDLNIFAEEDREILTSESEEKVSCLVKSLLDMYEEDPPTFVDFCRYQPYGAQTSAEKEHFTFYEHLIELLPPKWYDLFNRERRRRLDIVRLGKQRSISFTTADGPFINSSRLNQSFNEQHRRSRLVRLLNKQSEPGHNYPSTNVNECVIECDDTIPHNME